MEWESIVTEMKIHRVTGSDGQWDHNGFDVWEEWIGQQMWKLTDIFPGNQ